MIRSHLGGLQNCTRGHVKLVKEHNYWVANISLQHLR
jgi:hypothetical protein